MLRPDILNEPFDILTPWTSGDTATGLSQINPAGQLELDTNLGATLDAYAKRYRIILSPPNQFTLEAKVKLDVLGTRALVNRFDISYITSTWSLLARFCSDGLFIYKTGTAYTEVGADIVKCNAGAAWQTFRFQVDKTAGEASAVVETFLKEEGGSWASQGTVDCDYETGGSNGQVTTQMHGHTIDNLLGYVEYIRIASGLGEIGDLHIPSITLF